MPRNKPVAPEFPPLRTAMEKTEFLADMHESRAELKKRRETMTSEVAKLRISKAPKGAAK